MFLSTPLLVLGSVLLWLCVVHTSDVTVQVHTNRPFNDVSEKFVSFAIRPEDLFTALDGTDRKSVTRMAGMIGDSYIKFVGDFYFASGAEPILQNPSQILWKGFNSWTRAVNWTMIIPVPYSPNSWNPRQALRILNTSYNIGITDCIWQLGTDFSSSRAQDYVNELRTFGLMVDSFRPFVENWKVMGADVSAGSSVEETRRYLGMSQDLNAAFGWTQPSVLTPSNRMSTYIHDSDPALKVLLSKKAPVWLSLPPTQSKSNFQHNSNDHMSDEANHAFRWAATLGEAASLGFDAVFKRISATELERPSFSFYVTALFKKVMGTRVFPSRPLHVFAKTSKLYTHCAKDVSGGIAFMVVNSDERAVQISVRSVSKFMGTELWLYSLQQEEGVMLLNNEHLLLNSSLMHQTRVQRADEPVELTAAGMSVSFWVFPNADLEHCQFIAIDDEELRVDSAEKVVEKRYSSSDRLLKQLIREASSTNGDHPGTTNNKRRPFLKRTPRLKLESPDVVATKFFGQGLKNIFRTPASEKRERLRKRANERSKTLREATLNWLRKFIPNSSNLPLLKRDARKAEHSNFENFFASKGDKRNVITRKITEIKKLGKKTKPIFNADEFDEEEYFKKLGVQQEPEYSSFPEGDVHLKHITKVDGDDIEDIQTEKVKVGELNPGMSFLPARDSSSESKRLLPTEFYEVLPLNVFEAQTETELGVDLGSTLKSVQLPTQVHKKSRYENQQVAEQPHAGQLHEGSQQPEDFFKLQRELGHSFLNDVYSVKPPEQQQSMQEEVPSKNGNFSELLKNKYFNFYTDNYDNYFDGVKVESEHAENKPSQVQTFNREYADPRWDLSTLPKKRSIRALNFPQLPEADWRTNIITKDVKLNALDNTNGLDDRFYKYREKSTTEKTVDTGTSNSVTALINVKEKLSKFVSIVRRHLSQWYKTFSEHMPVSTNSPNAVLKRTNRTEK